MKNDILYYSVGALLYCPANKTDIADSIINEKFGQKFSLALCLEDTISDSFVTQAEQILTASLQKIYQNLEKKDFYLPKIFIRVRTPKQIMHMTKSLGDAISLLTGFILPKFRSIYP